MTFLGHYPMANSIPTSANSNPPSANSNPPFANSTPPCANRNQSKYKGLFFRPPPFSNSSPPSANSNPPCGNSDPPLANSRPPSESSGVGGRKFTFSKISSFFSFSYIFKLYLISKRKKYLISHTNRTIQVVCSKHKFELRIK